MKISQILERMDENKKNHEFIPTGFKKLDYFLDGGLLKKELVVIGADTGIGKSYLAGQMFLQIVRSGFKAAYFSLEISAEMIVSRILGLLSNIKPTRITADLLSEKELRLFTEAKGTIIGYEEATEIYDDLYTYQEIENLIRKNNFDLVVVDFIQNVLLENSKGMEKHEALTQISLLLQKLAKEKNICVIVLSQLSNMVARESSKSRPEYKGSGGIAQVADLGFFLERRDFENDGQFTTLELKNAKNRRGPSGFTFQFSVDQPGGRLREAIL